jgi:hypothetical protein
MTYYQPFSKIAAGAAMPLIGAGLGSLAGGVAGYYSDSDPKRRKRNALWSALGGGLGGGLGGYLLDTPAEAAGLNTHKGPSKMFGKGVEAVKPIAEEMVSSDNSVVPTAQGAPATNV